MLLNVEPSLFKYHFPSHPHLFVSEEFNMLNAFKTDHIVRLVPDSEKVQIGLVGGIRNAILMSPFSAPYGGFHFKSENNIYPHAIESFLNDLIEYGQNESLVGIQITLPPDIYCRSSNAKAVNAFIRMGFKMQIPDITNWVELTNFNEVYTHPASRTYYNQAVKKGLEFQLVSDVEESERVYNLIVENRARMGRPIHMTFKNIMETAKLFTTDFFKVVNDTGQIVAGAIFYHAQEKIAFAVFWGDAVEGRPVRAMDFLVLNLWSFYKSKGVTFIDLGKSTESGIPNEGLLRFKETHECVSSLKYTFSWEY